MALSLLSSNFTYDLIGVTVIILIVITAYYKHKFTFWEKAGLPNVLPPSIPFGNATKLMTNQIHIIRQFQEYYDFFKSRGLKHGGIYFVTQPYYVPVDPEIVKNILQKHFEHFVNHGIYIDESCDPLSGHLFNLEDAKWRQMRVKLTPSFSSGKMKMMFQTLVDCTAGLTSIMDRATIDKTPIDIKETFARFTIDIMGSCAFGLEFNSLKNVDCEFRKYGKKIFALGLVDYVKNIATFILPHGLLKLSGFKITHSDVEKFFMKTVKEIVEYRESNNISRRDLMHLLLQLKNRGEVADDELLYKNNGNTKVQALTLNELAAQVFGFFAAAFETSSSSMSFLLYELAADPKLQAKLRQEINNVLASHNYEITYESVMDMVYMDKVINEALRKYPPVAILPRVCTKDYMVPGTNVLIKKGTNVGIPVFGLHHDPEYFPEPEKFCPERFNEENKVKRHPFTFIPFGEGPRACIGKRFGLMQSKVGLTTLLKNYRIKLSPKTQLPLKFEKTNFTPYTEGGIWINVEKL